MTTKKFIKMSHNSLQKISRCLISVSDKDGIVELAKYLSKKSVEIISTGGTFKLLKESGIDAKDISEFTGFAEIMDGRVKTLHPKVHGGLLGIPDNSIHQKQAAQNQIESIDLLIVNLYPFVETLARTNNEDEIIENIDIGGPAMIRSAAKNFAYKTVVTCANDYIILQEEIEKNGGKTSFEFRKFMAARAFKNIADYDIAIANYFVDFVSLQKPIAGLESPSLQRPEGTFEGGQNLAFSQTLFQEKFLLQGELKQSLRYGENSHQRAAIYSNSQAGIVNSRQLQGKELSYNNFNDSDAAYNLLMEFNCPACVIVKHANPCGVAIGNSLLEAYGKALQSDSKSAFGGIVALNGKIDEALAQEIAKMFFEVIIAKEIDEKAQEILAAKKNLRLLLADFGQISQPQIKSISGGFLVQDFDQKPINKDDLRQVSQAAVSDEEINQLVFAMKVCKHAKSNAIVLVSDSQIVGIGSGQTSRVDACEIACKKAANFFDGAKNVNKAKGAYLASDAFFPFADGVEMAASYGVKAIIAPQGSIRDEEIIKMADEKGVALYFINARHFKH